MPFCRYKKSFSAILEKTKCKIYSKCYKIIMLINMIKACIHSLPSNPNLRVNFILNATRNVTVIKALHPHHWTYNIVMYVNHQCELRTEKKPTRNPCGTPDCQPN